jgi:hypothetical protein
MFAFHYTSIYLFNVPLFILPPLDGVAQLTKEQLGLPQSVPARGNSELSALGGSANPRSMAGPLEMAALFGLLMSGGQSNLSSISQALAHIWSTRLDQV